MQTLGTQILQKKKKKKKKGQSKQWANVLFAL